MPPAPTSALNPLALAIVALAGYVDAVTFRQFGGVYVSFMSGNTTALGVAAAETNWTHAGLLAMVILLFVLGVAAGTWLHQRGGARPASRLLLLISALLALGVVAPLPLGLLALSMGMLNAAVQQSSPSPLSLTYVTGSLVKVGVGLAERLSGRPWPTGWGPQALSWLALALGAVVGGGLWPLLELRELLPAAAAALVLALLARRGE